MVMPMDWREAARPRVVADAARTAALLYFVGALIISLEASVVATPDFSPMLRGMPWVLAGISAIGGVVLWRLPDRLPALAWPLVPAIPVGEILFLSIGSHDATASTQLALCLPGLFAAYQLKPGVARLTALEVVAAEIVLCILIDPVHARVEDAVGVSLILLGVMLTLITARDRLEMAMRSLRHDASHDALTGLWSRRTFDTDIGQLRDDDQASLILVDIDEFKTVNDMFGHAIGDEVLRVVAGVLTAHTRPADRVYRFGGDELAVLMTGCSAALAMVRAEAIRRAVESYPMLSVQSGRAGGGGRVTVSVGVASSPEHARRPDDMLRLADEAMYRAKDSGRNRTSSARLAACA
jgi:diguanylate cyclase (GGDEF)-like protein